MIETDRLIIRNYEEYDFGDFWEIFSNNNVTSHYGLGAFTYKRDAMDFFEGRIKKPLYFAITLKPSLKVIGEITLSDPLFNSVFQFVNVKEMGLLANERYQKKGYMTEGGRAIIKHFFEDLEYNGVYCKAFSYNIPSINFSKRCGMKVLSKGIELTPSYKNAEIVTSGITKQEFKNSKLYKDVNYKLIDDFSLIDHKKAKHDSKAIRREIEEYDRKKSMVVFDSVQQLFETSQKQEVLLDKSF